jgi:hypothetical protein
MDLSTLDQAKYFSLACLAKGCHDFRCQKLDGFLAIRAKLDKVTGALMKDDCFFVFECDLGLLLHQKRCRFA